jgi:predicted XRE-type DNA-binding protein
MSNQNVFKLITDDPVKFNTWSLKSKLVMVLVDIIRQQGWNQTKAAEKLKVSQPRMSNLFKGQLDKFSIDTLLEMLLVIGYKLDVSYNPSDASAPLEMKMKKAML